MRFRWGALILAVLLAGGIAAFFHRPATPVATTRPASTLPKTTSRPTTVAVAPPPAPRTLFELLRREQPAIATTQPLGIPVDFGDAGRFIVDHPIWLDDAGHLWITTPDAPPAEEVVRDLAKPGATPEQTHLVREPVRYVFWTNTAGKITPAVFIAAADGSTRIVTTKGILAFPTQRPFQFARAIAFADFMAVPCDDGIAVLHFGQTITEQFQPLTASKNPLAQPQVIAGVRGLLAWTPATATQPGSGVARYLNNAWTTLDPTDWPASIVQLSVFLDGTVQQFRQGEDGKIDLAAVLLDTPQVDEKRIEALLDDLGDLSEPVRTKAMDELQRMGPSAWPVMRKLSDNQPPEVQQRLLVLLAGATSPTIGAMSPIDGKLRLIDRSADASVLFYVEAGVTIPQPGAEPSTVAPAWICVHPDRSPELLPDLLTADLQPATAHLVSVDNDWYRTDATTGPRRFVGNALLPVLRASEKPFWMPIGADRRGRWLFRRPGKDTPTLLIDPTIQDPTPKLPVWTIRVKEGSVGWTKDGWPAIKKGGAWELHEAGWKAMDEKTNEYQTALADKPLPPAAPPTTSTTQSSDPGPILLSEPDGTSYYNGKLSLNVEAPKAGQKTWALPGNATGVDPVTLIKTPDGKLFLFNQPGRVLRLTPMPDRDTPFKIDATFTRNIPNSAPTRIWLDPAGRICIVADGNLSVLFPTGAIPHDIAAKMSAEELKANEPE